PSNTRRDWWQSSGSSSRRAAPAIPTPWPPRHTTRTSPTPCRRPPSSAPPSRSSCRGRCVRSFPRSRAVWTDQISLSPSKCAPPPSVGARIARPARSLLGPLNPGHDLFAHVLRRLLVAVEVHRVGGATLRARAQIGCVAEHLRERHARVDDLRAAAVFL